MNPGLHERKNSLSGNLDAFCLGKLQQSTLNQIGMMFNLQSRRSDSRISQQIDQQRSLEIADANTLGQSLVHKLLHRLPRLLDGRFALLHIARLTAVFPPGRVADRWIDVAQRHGEVHNVQVEGVDAPVRELLARNGADAVAVVERIPQLGDDEELFAFDDAFFDGARYALAGFYLVAVVCEGAGDEVSVVCGDGGGGIYRMRRRRDDSLF